MHYLVYLQRVIKGGTICNLVRRCLILARTPFISFSSLPHRNPRPLSLEKPRGHTTRSLSTSAVRSRSKSDSSSFWQLLDSSDSWNYLSNEWANILDRVHDFYLIKYVITVEMYTPSGLIYRHCCKFTSLTGINNLRSRHRFRSSRCLKPWSPCSCKRLAGWLVITNSKLRITSLHLCFCAGLEEWCSSQQVQDSCKIYLLLMRNWWLLEYCWLVCFWTTNFNSFDYFSCGKAVKSSAINLFWVQRDNMCIHETLASATVNHWIYAKFERQITWIKLL